MKNSSKILKAVFSLTLLFTLVTSGFSQTGEKMKKGAGNGAALGALAGVIFGNGDILSDVADGAVRGAATGAAVGLISGEVEKSKNKKAEKEQQRRIEQQNLENQNSEQQLISQFGRDNIEAYYALVDRNHARAKVLAEAGELSNDANHRAVAIWIKAMVAVDQRDGESANKEFDRLIVLDPIIDTRDQASIEVDKLVLEMRKERLGV